jgi:Skp family chaperone for outer membrane proteins
MSTKRNVIMGGIGLTVVFLSVWAIFAQDAAKPVPTPIGEYTKVGMLDVNYIFKKHAKFTEEMTQLKKEADEMDKQMKEQEGTLKTLANQLQSMTVGTTEYTELEGKIARSKAEWTIDVQTQRRTFLQREANVYRLTYAEIENEVEKYSREHNFDIIMRFMGDPVNSNNPESILANINKPIVYYKHEMDITPAILKILAEKHPGTTVEKKEEKKEGKKEENKEEKPDEKGK